MCSKDFWPQPHQRKFHEQLPDTGPLLWRSRRSRCCLLVCLCCTDRHRWHSNRRLPPRPPGRQRSRPPMDRQPAPSLSRAPKRMRRQTVSPRSHPRKRPTSPNTSCGLPRCNSQRLARPCDNPSPQLTTSSCRSLTSEVPSPRLPLPSGCHTLRSLRLCLSYSVSFSSLVLVGSDFHFTFAITSSVGPRTFTSFTKACGMPGRNFAESLQFKGVA